MGEIASWALGVLLGAFYPRPFRSRVSAVCFIGVMFSLGSGVTLASGEWAESPALILVDVGQIGLAALIAAFFRPYLVARLGPGINTLRRRLAGVI